MKVYLIYQYKEGPHGGGSQFLKALSSFFIKNNAYAETPEEADVFLFNSHHFLNDVYKLKKKYPSKLFFHRIDGPMRLYNKPDDARDNLVNLANKLFADATIFQSEWSKNKNYELGYVQNSFEAVIPNAPDPSIFFPEREKQFSTSKKTTLISTSWSQNWKKGFRVYEWLDSNLDFSKYDMCFVGNSPITFKNIVHIKPLPSLDLAAMLRKADIYIAASEKDPCSNSLLEALHCGLPALALNDGGHPELIGKNGAVFERAEEIPHLLDKIAANYESFRSGGALLTIDCIGKLYCDFMAHVLSDTKQNKYRPKPYKFYYPGLIFFKTKK